MCMMKVMHQIEFHIVHPLRPRPPSNLVGLFFALIHPNNVIRRSADGRTMGAAFSSKEGPRGAHYRGHPNSGTFLSRKFLGCPLSARNSQWFAYLKDINDIPEEYLG